MKIKKFEVFVIASLLICTIVGCSQKVSESEVKFSNDKVENMLLAINNGDYNNFTKDLSSHSKTVFTEKEVNKTKKTIINKIGNYIPNSKKFSQGTKVSQNNKKYIVAIYDAKFKNESGKVVITVTFDDDKKHAIEGIYFNSPKLRQK